MKSEARSSTRSSTRSYCTVRVSTKTILLATSRSGDEVEPESGTRSNGRVEPAVQPNIEAQLQSYERKLKWRRARSKRGTNKIRSW